MKWKEEEEDKQETQMKGGEGDKKIYEKKCVSVTGGGPNDSLCYMPLLFMTELAKKFLCM